jgi:fructose-1,6-bisphosphatase/inositol monophosphatase family enzyme
MSLEINDLKELTNIAIKAAKEAGEMISNNAGKNISYEKKETGESLAAQVVTVVDKQSQEIILKHLNPTLEKYDLGLLAEESEDDLSRFKKDYFWSVDPMDGTLPFIESRPGYCVSIGLVSKEATPIIGVIYNPIENTLYHAIKGQGAFRNEHPWQIELSSNNKEELIDRGGAVMNACWILENTPSYYCSRPKPTNGGGCVWDYAASACLFAEVGAWVSDMHGQPLELNREESLFMSHKGVLYASNHTIAQKYII